MKHVTNWHKTLANPDAYTSNWDWCVEHSEYHFDDSIQDQQGEWFDVLGTFQGDWAEERDRLVLESAPVNWATRKFYGDADTESPMLEQEEYRTGRW